MGEIKNGGPAFPQNDLSQYNIGPDEHSNGGMTLRDWFAGQALASLLKVSSDTQPGESAYAGFPELAASDAYLYADAMLAAREGGSNE